MRNKSSTIFIVLIIIYIIAGALTFFRSKAISVQAGNVASLNVSRSFSSWTGSDIPMDSSALNLIQPDSMVYRSYHSDTGKKVNLYVGFYSTMDKSDLAHSPLVCYSGQGWHYKTDGTRSITLSEPFGTIHISSVIVQKADYRELVWFWFQTKNYSSDTLWRIRIKLFFDKLLGRDTRNYFIRISTPIDNAETAISEKNLLDFVKQIVPELYEYI